MNLCNVETTGKLRTEGKTGALTGCKADAGTEKIQDGEHNGRYNRDNHDFLNVRNLAGDDHHRHRDGKTFKKIFDRASEHFSTR